MDERQMRHLLRQWRRQPAPGLPEGFSASVLHRLGPLETWRDAAPLLAAASALALLLAALVSGHRHVPGPDASPPPVLSLFGPYPDRAPFSPP